MHHDYLPYFYSFYLQSQMNQIRFFQVPSKIQASEKKTQAMQWKQKASCSPARPCHTETKQILSKSTKFVEGSLWLISLRLYKE